MGDKQKILDDDFDEYISKPIKAETLLNVLVKYLKK